MVNSVILFLEMHQPRRLSARAPEELLNIRPSELRILEDVIYDDNLNKRILERVCQRSYLPVLQILRRTRMRVSISISGSLMEQLRMWCPEVIEEAVFLVREGIMEPVVEPYHHSLASLVDRDIFITELSDHLRMIREIFGRGTVVFENTEFLLRNDWGKVMEELGAIVVLTEGVDRLLGWRLPTYIYGLVGTKLKLLLRHYRLSDDVGFRFSDKSWNQWPLTADKYVGWLRSMPGDLVFLGMDLETFGEHHSRDTGILDFLEWLPREASRIGLTFGYASSVATIDPVDYLDIGTAISWADVEKDESAWLGNEMQRLIFSGVLSLRGLMERVGLGKLWRSLLTSDHYYYMSTKHGSSGEVHSYFNPYNSPLKAFEIMLGIITSLRCILRWVS